MVNEKFEVGDRVRIVNLLANGKMPVGIIECINGAYHYVHTPVAGETKTDRCVYEAYPNELVHVTKEEYFLHLLEGSNVEDAPPTKL